jgi:uncharacterized membrane protein (DUF4010 family)
MDLENLLSRAALAFGIGLLVGLERGWRTREAAPGSRTAGIRTFTITGLLGGIVGAIAIAGDGTLSAGGAIILSVGFAAYAAVISAFSYAENKADATFSATTPIAAMLTFALGAYALIGNMWVAAAGGVAATAVLAAREELHGWVGRITWPELRSGLVLLAMTFVALPIVPSDPIGPFGGVNPREVWLIAIVLASVSFLGYAAVKYYGQRGVLPAAALGGLVSSTAVTIANARRAAAGEGAPSILAAAVAVASAVMFVRVMAIVAALNPALLALISPPLIAAAVLAVGFAFFLARGSQSGAGGEALAFRNPFSLWSVAGFAVFLAAIMVLGRAVSETLGLTGALVGAMVVGLADVDAVTVSTARLTPDPLRPEQAALTILATVASDTVSKIAIGAVTGRGAFAIQIAALGLACLAAGGAVFAATLAYR